MFEDERPSVSSVVSSSSFFGGLVSLHSTLPFAKTSKQTVNKMIPRVHQVALVGPTVFDVAVFV